MLCKAKNIDYQLIDIDGRLCLYTDLRINKQELPDKLNCYELKKRNAYSRDVFYIHYVAATNHLGTILTRGKFPFDDVCGYTPKKKPREFAYMNLSQFMSKSTPQLWKEIEEGLYETERDVPMDFTKYA